MAKLTSEEIEMLQKRTLTNLRMKLANDLEPNRYFAYLRQERIIDEDDEDLLRHIAVRTTRGQTLIDMISRRGAKAFEEFCRALHNGKTQSFLAERLVAEYDRLKADYTQERGKRLSKCLLCLFLSFRRGQKSGRSSQSSSRTLEKRTCAHYYHKCRDIVKAPPRTPAF